MSCKAKRSKASHIIRLLYGILFEGEWPFASILIIVSLMWISGAMSFVDNKLISRSIETIVSSCILHSSELIG
jgi:hypothetical protein